MGVKALKQKKKVIINYLEHNHKDTENMAKIKNIINYLHDLNGIKIKVSLIKKHAKKMKVHNYLSCLNKLMYQAEIFEWKKGYIGIL